jgi:hypothetical protein
MTPDEIQAFMAREFPQLVAEPRAEPGWSFHYPGRRTGVRRIIRATRRGQEGGSHLLLSVSDQLGREGTLLDFDNGTEEQLRELVEEQLRLFHDHFAE